MELKKTCDECFLAGMKLSKYNYTIPTKRRTKEARPTQRRGVTVVVESAHTKVHQYQLESTCMKDERWPQVNEGYECTDPTQNVFFQFL